MAFAEPAELLRPGRFARLSRLSVIDRAGLAGIALLTLVALAVPWIAPHGPTAQVGVPFLGAGHGGLLGTDDLGRDLLSRVLYGMRTSWFSALLVVAVSVVIGGAIGLLAGVAGGRTDAILMRLTDLALALPGPVLAIAVIVAIGPGLGHVLIAVLIVWWPYYARIVRGEARALAVRPHVDAARVIGLSLPRLAVRHVMPGVLPPVLVAASVDLGALVLTLAGLSFIGLGAPPPAPELGAMSSDGLVYLFGHPLIPIAPAVAVAALAFFANLAGDGLRNLLEDV
ncbi:MAG TPA: ABC transporter permease [Streptosporangiaceae bacterium]|jgi:peptide/nickel transport system permease protein